MSMASTPRSGPRRWPPVIVPLSLAARGGLILERMTDNNFRTWTKWIVTATGAVYLAQGVNLLL